MLWENMLSEQIAPNMDSSTLSMFNGTLMLTFYKKVLCSDAIDISSLKLLRNSNPACQAPPVHFLGQCLTFVQCFPSIKSHKFCAKDDWPNTVFSRINLPRLGNIANSLQLHHSNIELFFVHLFQPQLKPCQVGGTSHPTPLSIFLIMFLLSTSSLSSLALLQLSHRRGNHGSAATDHSPIRLGLRL